MNQFLSCQHEHEAARAVCIFNHTRRVAGLSEERRLLIARVSGDGDFRAEETGIRMTVNHAGRFDVRQHGGGNIEFL